MNKLIVITAVVLATVSVHAKVFAESGGFLSDSGITISGDASYYSEYVWRGILLDGDPVLQPGMCVAGPATKYGKVTARAWANDDLSNSDSRNASEEFDYILDYTYDFSDFSLSFGHTYYDYPRADAFSREFYAGVALPKIILAPSVFVYRDYGEPADGGGEGTYTVLNASYSMPVKISKYGCSVDFSGHYGYNYELFINGTGADVGLAVGLTLPLTGHSSLTPNINYSIPLGDLRKSSDGNQKNRLYSGVTLKYEI